MQRGSDRSRKPCRSVVISRHRKSHCCLKKNHPTSRSIPLLWSCCAPLSPGLRVAEPSTVSEPLTQCFCPLKRDSKTISHRLEFQHAVKWRRRAALATLHLGVTEFLFKTWQILRPTCDLCFARRCHKLSQRPGLYRFAVKKETRWYFYRSHLLGINITCSLGSDILSFSLWFSTVSHMERIAWIAESSHCPRCTEFLFF